MSRKEDEELVEIYSGGGGLGRAEMLRSILAGSDIEAVIVGGPSTAGYPVAVGGLGQFSLLVRESDAEEAAEVISSAIEGGG
ncbi:MAG: putative signal transducing protein [Actinomycetota bacterium]